jgi:hypothetical protein
LRATCVATTRSVGAWKVPTFSAREWRVHVTEVERGPLEEIGDRARDVDGQRRATPAGQRWQRLADGEDPGLAGGRLERPAAHRLARVAHERARGRRRHDEHSVPARRELV